MNAKKLKSMKVWMLNHKLMLLIVAVSFVALVLPGAYVFAANDTLPAKPADEGVVIVTGEEQEATTEEAVPAKPADEGVVIVTGEEQEATTEEVVPAEETDEGVVIVTGDEKEGATEETPETEVVVEEEEDNAYVTVKGHVLDSSQKAIDSGKGPYVQIACLYTEAIIPTTFVSKVDVNQDGSFQISKVPSSIIIGIITAGAEDYANAIYSLPETSITSDVDFTLYPGSKCVFTNGDELEDYNLCEGSFIKLKGQKKISLDMDIPLGEGLPIFGVHENATFTESYNTLLMTNYLVYYYKDSANEEEYKLIFSATPVTGYQFNYWKLNGNTIPQPYTVKAGTPIEIDPFFTEVGKMTVGGIVKDKEKGTVIKGAYGFVLGYDIDSGAGYVSDYKQTGDDGVFVFDDVPDGIVGVIVAAAKGYATQPQVLSAITPRTEFNLVPGVICTIQKPEEFGTVMLEAGSSITFTGFDKLELDIPIDLGADFPPIGFPTIYDQNLVLGDKGQIEYSYVHEDATHAIKALDLKLKVYPKSDYAFKNWKLDGVEFSGNIPLKDKKSDFTVEPVFKAATPYTFRTYIKNHKDERITNAYAYLVGVHELTGEVYLSNPVTTDKDGVFAIENIPYDVYGIVVVGAPGYVNRFDYCDCDVKATFFTLDEGVQIDFQMPETASTVYIEQGSGVKLTVGGFPIEFALPYDVEFGNLFLPFGITPKGTFKFMEDGRANYTVTNNENAVVINSLSITFRVVPKDGYVFTGWLKDGQPISGEYTLKDGEKDFSITPVFEVPAPPQPTPVIDPTSPLAKTFDSIGDYFEALAILIAGFAVVYSIRRFVFKRK